MAKLSLLKAKINQRVKVVEILGGSAVGHRMLSMGIYPGREIIKFGHIALRGPVTLKVGRSYFALGHSMAAKIMVETDEK